MTVQKLKLLQGKALGLFLCRQKSTARLLMHGGIRVFLLSLVQAGLNGESILTPSFPSFTIISLMEENIEAAALDCEESSSPAWAAVGGC